MFLCLDAVYVILSTTEYEHAHQYDREDYVPNLPLLALDPSVRDDQRGTELESAIDLPPLLAVTVPRCLR